MFGAYPASPLVCNPRVWVCQSPCADAGPRPPFSTTRRKTLSMRTALKSLTLLVLLLLPATVFAQATLTGTVRDASGGVLPGVTVEASSPALIEKTRTATTDES